MISQVTVGNLSRQQGGERKSEVRTSCAGVCTSKPWPHWPSHVVVAPVTTAKQACMQRSELPTANGATTMLAMACAACCLGPILVPQGDSCMEGSYPML